MNHYEELGVSPSATQDEIRQAYRNAVKLMHPDRQTDPAVREIAQKQMIRLNAIAQVLLDPDQRLQYDELLSRTRARQQALPAPDTQLRPAVRLWRKISAPKYRPVLTSVGAVAGVGLVAGLAWLFSAAVTWLDDYGTPAYSYPVTATHSTKRRPPAQPSAVAPVPPQSAPTKTDAGASGNSVSPPTTDPASPPAGSAKTERPPLAAAPQLKTVIVVSLNPAKPELTAPSLPPPPDLQDSIAKDSSMSQLPPSSFNTPPPPQPAKHLSPPVLISQVYPQYPVLAKEQHIEGVVKLTAQVGLDGHIESAEVVNGPHALANAAKDAVLKWRYRPATIDDAPVECNITISVEFWLR